MIRIVALFTVLAAIYGVAHDQITARVCIEYFTIAHAALVRSDSPALLGFVWGVLAGAPAGAFAGTTVALAARDGARPKLDWRHFLRPALRLAALMALSALLAGAAGYVLTARAGVRMVADYADRIPPDRHPRFMAVVYAHLASFGVGLAGTLAIAFRSQRLRWRLPR
jgi:hypothetical protein